MKKALITGILGQDGANMAEYLLSLEENVEIYGMMRRTSNVNKRNIEAFENHPNLNLVYGDLTYEVSIDKLVREIQPDYFINFGAIIDQTEHHKSFNLTSPQPETISLKMVFSNAKISKNQRASRAEPSKIYSFSQFA